METKAATSFEQLDTPSLLLDLDIMETNLREIAAFANQQGIGWRPHIKTHKCVEIARKHVASHKICDFFSLFLRSRRAAIFNIYA